MAYIVKKFNSRWAAHGASVVPWITGLFAACTLFLPPLPAQSPAEVKTAFVRLGNGANALLFEPAVPNPKSRIALINTHEGTGNNFNHPSGPQLASRGYRVLIINFYGDPVGFEGLAPHIGEGIRYVRGLPGVERVVLLGHSGGGPVMTFYQNLAEHGPSVCQGKEKLYPCTGRLENLPKADGLVLLDSHIGTGFTQLTYTDPAIRAALELTPRDLAFDMFDPRNGFDRAAKQGTYSAEFTRGFFAAQAARNEDVIAHALDRLSKIDKGKADYSDDEPFVVPASLNARLLQSDVRLVSHTREPHPLLKADGTTATQIVQSVRPPLVGGNRLDVDSYEHATQVTTVRRFLAGFALRAGKDYNMTADSITGIDWGSSNTSAIPNVEGVHVPTLIIAMSCHYFLVPDEMIYNHSGAADKQYLIVEGASHGFMPCKPEYGDTRKRVFDSVDNWLGEGGRFGSR